MTPPLTASFSAPFVGTPPDPVIAAGPEALVVVTNSGIALLSKTGQVLDTAFADGFDPKVLFDPHSARFVALALNGTASPFSSLRIRVSKSSAPHNLDVGSGLENDWWAYTIDADRDGGMQVNNAWADFPSLGVDQHNLYITSGMIPNGGGTWAYVKVWVIPKEDLTAGGPLTIFEYGAPPGPRLANPVSGITNYWVSATTNFDLAAEHMVATPLDSVGGYGRSTLWTVNDPGGTPTLSAADLLLPGWTGNGYPGCPQLGGGAPIDSGFVATPHAVERNGSLWMSHTSPDAQTPSSRNEIHWYEIEPSAGIVLQSGQVSDPVRCYFYSAIQPDSQGNVALVMSGVDGTIHPSAFYAARRFTDPPGTMRPPAVLKGGLSNYSQVFGFRNRWGDYGGIAADPVTDAIWMFHEYATATTNVAGTWIGAVALSPPVDGSSFVLGRARVRANTNNGSRNNGRIVLRGLLNANDLNGNLFAVLSGGLVVRVDGAGLAQPEYVVFAPGDCTEATSGVIRCEAEDRYAVLRPVDVGPNVFKVSVVARRRAFGAPLDAADLFGSLIFDETDRRDRIGNCRLSGSSSHVVRCQESGVVVTTVTPSATSTPTATATATATATTGSNCAGDCNGTGFVSIADLITGINILLEYTPLTSCAAADISGNGIVTVDETVTALGDAFDGCGTHPAGPAASGPVQIELGVVAGSAASQVAFGATFHALGQSVAATQNDISFDPQTPIESCVFNDTLGKNAAFAFFPHGCAVGVDCTSVRALVFAFDNRDPIPDGALLYTCTVDIYPAAVDGTYPLLVSDALGSTPGGRPVFALGIDGAVVVQGVAGPTPTATATSPIPETPTSTPPGTPTVTPG